MHFLHLLLLRESLRKTEVDHLNLRRITCVVHKIVLGLEISMHDTVAVKMFDSRQHLTHDVCGLVLGESLSGNDTVKKFTTRAVFHDNMNVAVIDVAFVKLNNVGMIDSPQNGKLLLQKSNILGDTLSKDGLYSVGVGWVGFSRSSSHSSEMATTDHLDEVVDSTDICCTESL